LFVIDSDPNLKNPLQNQIDALKLFVQKSEEAKNKTFCEPIWIWKKP
jgi:hypothetical protein